MNVNQIDLNLLKAFDALYIERNVSRAGERIGIAQPSMSNALNRLRDLFNDPLFQRMSDGMKPTKRAEEIAPKVRQMLGLVEEIWEEESFDLSSATDHVQIAASDLTVMGMAPKLMTYLQEYAPKLQISWLPLDKNDCFQQLEGEEIDFVIGTFGSVPARFHRKLIHKDHFVCIAREGHPKINGPLSVEDFISQSHVLMTLRRDYTGMVDVALKKIKQKRHVAMTCAQFTPIPDIVSNTDLLATIPVSYQDKAQVQGCQVLDMPFDLPAWEMDLIWTQKTQASALGQFLTEAFFKINAK